MNILIIALDFKPLPGGIAEYTHQIAKHLTFLGNEVIVLTPEMEGDQKFDKKAPYKILRFDLESIIKRSHILRNIQVLNLIKNNLKKYNSDILISNVYGAFSTRCFLVSKILNIPYVIFTHGLEIKLIKKLEGKLRFKFSIGRADKIFSVSSYTKKLLINRGVKENKISLIPGGVGKEFINSSNIEPSIIREKYKLNDKKIIFSLGRLVERKGFDMVIKSLPKIIEEIPNAIYLIGGRGPYKEKLKQLTKKYNISEYIIFAGYISEEEKKECYKACDIFVMPCRELENGSVEGFGIVFLEANAFGKPVIGGRSGGALDAIKHNETGLLVNPRNIEEISNSIIYLLKNPRIAKEMGNKGKKRAKKQFTWEILSQKVEKELQLLNS